MSLRNAFTDYAESLGHPRPTTTVKDEITLLAGYVMLIAIAVLHMAGLSWGWAIFYVFGLTFLARFLTALARR